MKNENPSFVSPCKSNEVFYRVDPTTLEILYVGDMIDKIFGYSDMDWQEHPDLWKESIHPEDRKRVIDETAKAIDSKENIIIEYRIIRNDGVERWVENRIGLDINDEGKIISIDGFLLDITEQKKAEKLLCDSVTRYNTLFENTDDAIFICNELGCFIEVNHAACEKFGYSRDELWKLMPWDIVTQEYSELISKKISDLFVQGKMLVECACKRKNGVVVPVEINGRIIDCPDKKAAMCIVRDISDRKALEKQCNQLVYSLEKVIEERTHELEKALEDSEAARDKINAIIKAVGECLIVVDNNNKIILMNRTAEELLDVRFSEVYGRSLHYVIDNEDAVNRLFVSSSNKNDKRTIFEYKKSEHDTPLYWGVVNSEIKDKNGEKTGSVIAFHDITDEHEIERMKTHVITTAAHELRTPLTSIVGFSEILLTRADIKNDDQIKYLSIINQQAMKLSEVITNFLDISRFEANHGIELIKTYTNINSIIHDVVSRFKKESKYHVFKVDLPDNPLEIHIDKEKIELAIFNIVSNAVKFSEEGSIIKIAGEIVGKYFQITIQDHGVGMTPEQTKHVFDTFYRANSADSAIPGVGLGLTITKYIIEEHGGTIHIESEIKKNTIVKLLIPL